MMLHTKYQGSRPYGFRQEDFFQWFPSISICKQFDLGRVHFWPKVQCIIMQHNLNKLGRGPLGDASYQISSSRPCSFRLKEFKCFPYISLCKACDPVAPGA